MQRPVFSIDGRYGDRRYTQRRGRAEFVFPAEILRSVIAAPALASVPLAVVLLISRRMSGALAQPLPAGGLVVCGLLLGAWALLHRQWSTMQPRQSERVAPAADVFRSAVVAAAVLALWLPGSPLLGILGLLAIVAAEELTAWHLRRRRRGASVAAVSRAGGRVQASFAPPSATASDAAIDDFKPDRSTGETHEHEAEGQDVVAELVRLRAADGRESIRGRAQANFAIGQRTVPVHVAFCPPLAGLPLCEAEQSDGPAASVRVAQVLPYGARFEVKLPAPAPAPISVEIEFSAIEKGA